MYLSRVAPWSDWGMIHPVIATFPGIERQDDAGGNLPVDKDCFASSPKNGAGSQ
jgi:hypothetical protein